MIMASSSSSRTITLDLKEPVIPDNRRQTEEAITLRLGPRLKKKVSWKEGTVDNEFLQRKSSKECCIFHERQDEEDSSDDELSWN